LGEEGEITFVGGDKGDAATGGAHGHQSIVGEAGLPDALVIEFGGKAG
jgi:hypothetical protein